MYIIKKKVLTPDEIISETERRKIIRREKLEKKAIKLIQYWDREDTIFTLSSLINKITK